MKSKFTGLTDFLTATSDQIDTIHLTFKQIEIIIGCNLPENAYQNETWWGNSVFTEGLQSQSWLDADWKVEKVIIFNREVKFIRLGKDLTSKPSSIKSRFENFAQKYRQRWFNMFPDDQLHFPIETQSGKLFWLEINEDLPNEIDIFQYNNHCGWIKFICRGKLIELADIRLKEKYRGDGLGRRILTWFIRQAYSNGFELIEARLQPEGSFPFERLASWYEGLGFKPRSSNSNWYELRMIRKGNQPN